MYLCICKSVSDRQIRRDVASGEVITLRDLVRLRGVGTCCGKCIPAIREELDEALSRAACAAPAGVAGLGLGGALPSPA